MKRLTALFVARLQPLHKGHVYALKHLFKRYPKVVIAVGSINKKNSENPFSFQERREMLDAVLGGYKRRYNIIGIKDYKSDKKWLEEISRKARFDIVVTGNAWTKRCFIRHKIIKPGMLKPSIYNATRIRKLIRGNWQGYVPKQIIPIIKKHFSKQ